MAFDRDRYQREYPFKSNFLDLKGLKLHYLDEGQGEPVVMLHGNPSWSFYYRELVKALRGGYRCVVPDHIGMGLSDKPGDARYAYTLESRVDDLEALLESLSIKEGITLVVHDWGGMIGFAYVARHPERIKRLVVLNTAAFLLPRGKGLPWTLKLGRDSWLGALLIRGFNAFSLGAAYTGVTRRPMSAEIRAAYTAPYDSWADRIATLRFVQDIPLFPGDRAYELVKATSEKLPALGAVPMLGVWGMKDFVFDADFLKEWERRFPKTEFHRIPDAGHYVLEDAPEIVIPKIKEFLGKGAAVGGAALPR